MWHLHLIELWTKQNNEKDILMLSELVFIRKLPWVVEERRSDEWGCYIITVLTYKHIVTV